MRKVKLKNIEIINLVSAVNSFQEVSKDEKVPATISYLITKNNHQLQLAYKSFEDKRQVLISEHVKRDETGNPIAVLNKQEGSEEQVPELEMKDESIFKIAAEDLMGQSQEVQLFQIFNIEESIKNWIGTNKVMEELWYLIDIINNYGNNK